MSKQLFGTDGIRGVPGKYPLDDATLEGVGAALGVYLASQSPAGSASARVLFGRDTRESGPHIEECIARGLAARGVETVSSGVLTTPGVAWLVRNEGFAAGVIISASHNPYHDNGVKLVSSAGMKFSDATEFEIEREILAQSSRERVAAPPRIRTDPKLDDDYLASLRADVLDSAIFSGLKVVLDCANGAASRLAPLLFRSLGADMISINDQPDGRNINAGCGSLHPEGMQKKVLETRASLGVAFDGDADRAIFSSSAGRLVNGDGVLLSMGRYMQEHGLLKGPAIVGTTMANLGLERALEKSGLKLIRTDVGDRYVLEEMQHTGANLGGEQSGHILFLDDATTGDGMLTAIKIASLVALKGPLDSLVADLKIFPQTIVNVRVRSKPPLDTLPEITALLAQAGRELGNSGRIILRYSGTEPLARVMVEAEHDDDVRRWSESLATALRSSIGAV